MSTRIILDCSESTMSSPAAFFTSFVEKRKIIGAISEFQKNVPDPSTEESWISNCSYVSKDKMEYHLEHTIDALEDPFDESTYKSSPITEIVSFKGELERLFRNEYVVSKKHLRQKYGDSAAENRNKKDLLAGLRDLLSKKIFPCIEIIQTDALYKGYEDLCLRPLYALIRLIYREFSAYTPSYRYDTRIAPIIKTASDANDIYEPQILDLNVVDALKEFRLQSSEQLFMVDDLPKDIENLKSVLRSTDIIPPACEVCLKGRTGPINYMLGLLIVRMEISRRTLQRWGCIKIGKTKFLAIECDREFSRYPLLHPDDAARIRHLIDSYMV